MTKLAVFDLDFTVWPMNADQDVYPSLRQITGGVADGRGREIKLYPDIKQILALLKEQNVTIGIASKDRAPDLCREILEKHGIMDYFDTELIEIYPCRTKVLQFEKFWARGFVKEKTIFFDDSRTNVRELEKHGVHSIQVTHKHGATLDIVKTALKRISSK